MLRDEVEPMIVVQQQASPLSAYRSWFAGGTLDGVWASKRDALVGG